MTQPKLDAQKNLVLGIDIGTTSVKVCLVDKINRQVVSKQSKDTQANVPSDLGSEGNKQYVPKIVSALHSCISRLPKDQLRRVYRIGISGQMHGMMLWSTNETRKAWECIEASNGCKYEIPTSNVSALYTWQDSRCDPQFLATLPSPQSHLQIYSGHGCATLFWMARHKPERFERFNRAGTIQDFIVAMLCNLDHPIMSMQNAASWGYFDTSVGEWNTDLLQAAAFPVQLLPKVLPSGNIAGTLTQLWFGISSGTEVGVGLGDFQCSVLATLENPTDAVMNISTSAQLAFVMPAQFEPKITSGIQSTFIEYFPYFEGKYLAVAASLNGGNSLATFVRTLQQWTLELGFQVPQSKIWERIVVLGEEEKAASSLNVVPTLLGERNSPEQNASISNIDLGNLGLGQVFKALCQGVIQNLHAMMPRDVLLSHNIERVIGIGAALTRNKVLQQAVNECYQLPLDFSSGGDAALGAAIAVLESY